MAAQDTPAETFKRALGHAARALAEQPELEVTFGSDGPKLSNGVLTLQLDNASVPEGLTRRAADLFPLR